MALTLKHIHDQSIIPFFKSIVEVLKELEKHDEIGYIYTVITYMAVTGKVPDKNEFFDTAKRLETVNKEKIMPTLIDHLQSELMDLARQQAYEKYKKEFEQLRPKFLQEGRQEGQQEERIKMAKILLSKGVSIDIIAEVTKLSEKEIKNLVH